MRDTTYIRSFCAPAQSAGPYEPRGAAEVTEIRNGVVRLCAGETMVEITALAPDLFRAGMFGQGRTPRYRSEALSDYAWPRHTTRMTLGSSALSMFTQELIATIQLYPLRIEFSDTGGRRFAEDDPELGMGFTPILSHGQRAMDPLGTPAPLHKRHRPGERTGGLEKTGSRQVFWNLDLGDHHAAEVSNLYTSIPFILAMDQGRAWGMFPDNPGNVELNLARQCPDRLRCATTTGDLVYYVFGGPTPRRVVDRYNQLTGRTPMPPL